MAALVALLSLPAVVAAIEAAAFYVRHRSNGFFVSSGEQREYLLHVPGSYDRAKPTPLVISMHGGALWPTAQRDISGWNRVADEHGFIVVYPSGVSSDGPRHWRVGRGAGLMRDVRFIAELIDTLQASWNLDPTRIYADGLSNGGGMAFVLSCTLSDRIAAVGLVASAQFLPWSWCTDRRAVPMIAFHGTVDRFAHYEGGALWVARGLITTPHIPKWVANWARRNRCTPRPIDDAVATDVTRRSYANCARGAAVVLYTVHGGGHSWPGGKPEAEWFIGPTSRSIDATSQMWAFFRAHPLSRK